MSDTLVQSNLSLEGRWGLALDPLDVGIAQAWWNSNLYSQSVYLPGSLPAQGIGDKPTATTDWTANLFDLEWATKPQWAEYGRSDNIKFPFFLLPSHRYVGAAWYRREIEIPVAWAGRRIVLNLERPHWESRVWIDDREIGSNRSLCVPHVYDLGTNLAPGLHMLTVRVDNRMLVNVGLNAHSVTDHTQGNWNGIVGRIELSSTSPVWLDDPIVHGDIARRSVKLTMQIGNATGNPGRGTLCVGEITQQVEWTAAGGRAEMEIKLGESAILWDEFKPALHQLEIKLDGDNADDRRTVRFGLREFSTEGTQFIINGRRTFLRGTLECCIFPRTGYPPTDIESWKRIFHICREHGLNHLRFHSWCPPEAAFNAADEIGIYLQIEGPVWANQGTTIGDGLPVDDFIYEECDKILHAYGNHPSFVMMAYGNEPAGQNVDAFFSKFVDYLKRKDSRHLYTGATGWTSVPENQFHSVMRAWGKIPVRGRGGWLEKDYRDGIAAAEVPIVSHEIGQHCAYPDFSEIPKYTGHLKATNFEIFRDSLAAHGMVNQARDFHIASGKLQVICYKEDIEAALRTKGMGGFQLLDLHDFPGQGTALVGVLDAFWGSKGYVSPQDFRRFCSSTVLLARLPNRVWTNDQTLIADVEAAHFGLAPLQDVTPYWRIITTGGRVVAEGTLPKIDLPIGNGMPLGQVTVDLAAITEPTAARFVVGIAGTSVENDWSIWIYPSAGKAQALADIVVSPVLNDQMSSRLEQGGSVVLLPPPKTLSAEHPKGSFIPVFWNKLLMKDQPGQTLGLLCDRDHPALAAFPTDIHSDWQWADLCDSSRCLVLDSLPPELRPIVQPIDDWNANRRLGLIFECRVGKGRALICCADLETDLEHRPAARQLRRSLLNYAASQSFNPTVKVPLDQLRALLQPCELVDNSLLFDPSQIPMTD
jgi:hypothetical protein